MHNSCPNQKRDSSFCGRICNFVLFGMKSLSKAKNNLVIIFAMLSFLLREKVNKTVAIKFTRSGIQGKTCFGNTYKTVGGCCLYKEDARVYIYYIFMLNIIIDLIFKHSNHHIWNFSMPSVIIINWKTDVNNEKKCVWDCESITYLLSWTLEQNLIIID